MVTYIKFFLWKYGRSLQCLQLGVISQDKGANVCFCCCSCFCFINLKRVNDCKNLLHGCSDNITYNYKSIYMHNVSFFTLNKLYTKSSFMFKAHTLWGGAQGGGAIPAPRWEPAPDGLAARKTRDYSWTIRFRTFYCLKNFPAIRKVCVFLLMCFWHWKFSFI